MMDSAEVQASAVSESKQDTAPTSSNAPGQEQDAPRERKKRAASKPTNEKAKKRKKVRAFRPAPPGYTVHQGEDMLLVISNYTSQYEDSAWTPKKQEGKKKMVPRGKVKAKAKVKAKQSKAKKTVRAMTKRKDRWGQCLPEELLVSIFQMVVVQDGAVPFLCRVGRVCRRWNTAASSPVLWRKVTVGHCWFAQEKSMLPKTVAKIMKTFHWLAQNRFSQLRDFSLCHWKKNATSAVEVVSQFCPHLRSLKLSYCTGVAAEAFHSLGLHSRSLQSIDLQNSEFQVEGALGYLEHHGSQIKQILFSQGVKNDRLLTAITRGCCPELEFLEVNTKLDSKNCELPVYIQGLQMACPKLKTFRMLNVKLRQKSPPPGADSELGFPLLEELCIATTSFSYVTDRDLWDILFGSTRLRVLDLRGCSRITPDVLTALPCPDLECLFLGQYFTSTNGSSSSLKKGFHTVTQKWSRTLKQLDIANQLFTTEDLELAMSHLAQAADTLHSLNLSGTRITPPSLRQGISLMTALSYLNLSACRYLPRGLKRIYRGQEDIRQLLDKLE